MNDIDIERLHALLLAERETLMRDLSSLAIHHPLTDDWELRLDSEVHETADNDMMADSSEFADEQIATLALLETRYRNIVRALQKIETGTYGVCEISGEPIESARLNANPAARTCLKHLNDEADLPL